MLLILFGLPGAGKTFVGNILRDDFGFFFYDIDDDLTTEIKGYVSKKVFVPDNVRQKFFENIVLKKLRKLQKTHKKLVMSQALPKESIRKLFVKNFPHAKFVLVSAKAELRESRLDTRNSLVSKEYAKKVDAFFDKPKIKYFVINNNKGKDSVARQLREIIGKISE